MIYMLESYCAGEKVALFKSRCNRIARSSTSAFRHTVDGAAAASAQDASPDQGLPFPTAGVSTSPLAFRPT